MDKVFCVPKYVTVKLSLSEIKKKNTHYSKCFQEEEKITHSGKILKFMSYNLPEMWTQEVEFFKENNPHS